MASLGYLARHPRPKVLRDLPEDNCFRQCFAGGVALFEKRSRAIEVAVMGLLINSQSDLVICAALDGIGIACVPAIYVEHTSRAGRSVELLEDWTPRSVGVLSLLSEPALDAGDAPGIIEALEA